MSKQTQKPRYEGYLPEVIKQAKVGEQMILFRVLPFMGSNILVEGIVGERNQDTIYLWHDNKEVDHQENSNYGNIKPTTKYCLRLNHQYVNSEMKAALYETKESRPPVILPANINNRESLLYALKIHEND